MNMTVTKGIPHEELEEYFAQFTRRFLQDGSPEAVDVEVLEPDWGDQVAVQGARLLGITYDRHSNALEFELDSGDHRLLEPEEVWTIEEEDGFLSAVEVVHSDGTREVVSIKRVGLRRLG
jgi:Family of unknown function (DUF5335)